MKLALAGGLGVFGAVAVLTLLIALGVGLGSAIIGDDVATPILGTIFIGLYALALTGVGLAFGGVISTSFAGEAVAAIVIVTFLIDFLVPALDLPAVIRELALTSHLGQPMVDTWAGPASPPASSLPSAAWPCRVGACAAGT